MHGLQLDFLRDSLQSMMLQTKPLVTDYAGPL